MDWDEALARIDAHMARSDELMDQNRAAFQDLRTFLRETTLRQEKVMNAVVAHLNQQTREIEAQTKAIHDGRHEFVEESRAHRAALFKMLDRLDGGDSPATA